MNRSHHRFTGPATVRGSRIAFARGCLFATLAKQANSCAAPLTLVQFRDVLVPSVPGCDSATNVMQIDP